MSSMSLTSSISLTSACSDLINMDEFDDNDLAETLMEETVEQIEERGTPAEQKHSVVEENKELVEEKYVKDEVTTDDEETKVEQENGQPSNWAASPLLPPGWMFKQEGKELKFISQEGTVLNRQELEMLHKFKPKKTGKGWKSSEYLPEGWMGRKTGVVTQFKTETGEKLTHYKSAASYMRASDRYSQSDVERLYLYPTGVKIFLNKKNCKKQKQLNTWKANEYLPDGWMCKGMKAGSKRIKVKTDDGTILKTYKSAAKFMTTSDRLTSIDFKRLFNYPHGERLKEQTCQKERSISKRRGVWKTNEYLPEGWKCIEVKAGTSRIHIETDEGKIFKSYKSAAKFMKSSDKFSIQHVKRLYKYPNGEMVMKPKENPGDWTTNEYLPEGWMCMDKTAGSSNIRVKTEDGNILTSYKAAAKFMDSSDKTNAEDVKRLYQYPNGEKGNKKQRKVKSSRGWSTNEFLPEGWMGKKTGANEGKKGGTVTHFRTETGKGLTTYKAAATYLRSSKNYTEEDISKLYLYPDGENRKTKKVKKQAQVKEGKVKDTLTTETKTEHLQDTNMSIAEKHYSVDIVMEKESHDKLEAALSDSWLESIEEEELALMAETKDTVQVDNSEESKENSIELKSIYELSVIDKSLPITHDVHLVESEESKELKEESTIAGIRIANSEGASSEETNTSKKLDLSGWIDNEHLPEGWLCKGNNKKVTKSDPIMSKEGTMLTSYKTAAAFMKTSGSYSQDQIDRLYLYPEGKRILSNILDENWKTNVYLPEGWKCKEKKAGSSYLYIQTEAGVRLCNYKGAAEFMEQNGEYSKRDVERLYLYPDGKNHSPNQVLDEDWKTNEYLPDGWTCKDKKEGSSYLYIKTDTGVRLHSYRAAAEFMEENSEFTKEDVEKVYLYPDGKNHSTHQLLTEEWNTNEFLPEGWTCKDKKEGSSYLNLQTNTGLKLHSYKTAAEYMEDKIEYTEEDLERLYLYPDGKNHSQNKRLDEDWKTNEYLPEGWKCKDKKEGCSYLNILSKTGVRLHSYRAAAEYMEENSEFTKENIEQLYLYPDGKNHSQDWKTNEYLPEGWLCKERKEGTSIYIKDNNGMKFTSHKAAAESMEGISEFTKEDVERFYLYPDGKNHSPHTQKLNTNEYLPEGWTCKDRKEGKLYIQTETGMKLSSYKSAVDYMEESSEFTKEDVEKLYLYPDGKNHSPNQPLPKAVDEVWITNEYLPEGWTCKEGSAKTCIKTNTGVRLRSYKAAVEFMEENSEYTKEDVGKIYFFPDGKNHAQSLDEDWKTNEYLPAGWMCKDIKSGLNLKTDTGMRLWSYRTAAVYMETDAKFSQADIERLYLYPDGRSHAQAGSGEWKTSEYLPEGWKYKESGTHHLNLLTEDGTRLSSYIAATRYMQYRGGYTSTSLHQLYTFPDGKNHFVGKKMPSLEG